MNTEDVAVIMERFPKLTANGFSCAPEHFELYRQRLRNSDLAMLSEIEVLLAGVHKTRQISRRSECHSYVLKHQLERLVTGKYIANGQLILVAEHCGFRFKVYGPNANFNMAIKDVRHIGAPLVPPKPVRRLSRRKYLDAGDYRDLKCHLNEIYECRFEGPRTGANVVTGHLADILGIVNNTHANLIDRTLKVIHDLDALRLAIEDHEIAYGDPDGNINVNGR